MNDDFVEQIGTRLDVYAKPATVFVAGFIGSPAQNSLPARAAPDGQSAMLDDSDQAIPYRMPDFASRDRVTVGIRPEHQEPAARSSPAPELTAAIPGQRIHATLLPTQVGRVPIARPRRNPFTSAFATGGCRNDRGRYTLHPA